MLESMRKIVRMGAGAIGGCCGTTPEHIKAI
ncbi:MAG: homocysteine S-methyltransferase family protein, partial [Clostridia bacterium]|nr:homocysteine S-methyltransferase family protein [Clostridia bacterium]